MYINTLLLNRKKVFMSKKNIEELTDQELIDLYKELTNFIKYLNQELETKE